MILLQMHRRIVPLRMHATGVVAHDEVAHIEVGWRWWRLRHRGLPRHRRQARHGNGVGAVAATVQPLEEVRKRSLLLHVRKLEHLLEYRKIIYASSDF